MRLLNLIYFHTRALWHALRCDTDLFLVGSYPPVASGLLVRIVHGLRGIPYIYHCLDVQPESASMVGKLRQRWLVNVLRWFDRLTCESAAAVVTLSDEMATTLRQRGWGGDSIRLINNFHTEPVRDNSWATVPETAMSRDLLRIPPHSFQVVFAGNLGSFQGLGLLIDAAWLLRDRPDIQFIFMGAGERERELKNLAGGLIGETVHFVPFQPTDIASAIMGGADLAVLSLLPGVFATAVPSKMMMYLRAGCRLLALIEPDCEVARLIGEHSLGIVPGARQPEVVAGTIVNACDRWPQLTTSERQRIFEIGEQLYGHDRTLAKWSELILELDQTARSAGASAEPALMR